jgi:ATP-dependent DNA ligase
MPPSVGLAASALPRAGAVFHAGLVFFWGSAYLFHMPKAFEFCAPDRRDQSSSQSRLASEIKYDGYRLRLERDGDRVRLITKGGTTGASAIPGSRPR